MAAEAAIAWPGTPTQNQHVVVTIDDNGVVPAIFFVLVRDDQVARSNGVPVRRQAMSLGNCGPGRTRWRCGGTDDWSCKLEQLLVKAAAYDRHEATPIGMHTACRQAGRQFGGLRAANWQHMQVELRRCLGGEQSLGLGEAGGLWLAGLV